MDKDDDPWEILGVSKEASEAEIKKAFRKGALKYHPDKQTTEEDKAAASDIFAKFSDAYDTLTDPVKRYDWKLANEKRMKRASGHGGSSTPGKPSPKAHVVPSPKTGGKKAPPPPGKRNSAGTPTQKRPDGSAPKKHPPANKRASAPPPSRRAGSGTTPVPGGRKQAPPKRSSNPDSAQKPHSAGNHMSAPPPPSMGWRRQSSDGSQPNQRRPAPKHRDPFDIFESVMKEEFGDDYKDKEESGWKSSIGVPGLSKINPFRQRRSESSTKGMLYEQIRPHFHILHPTNIFPLQNSRSLM